MTAIVNFLIGGGLLAVVQAILTAYNLARAKTAGANAASLAQSETVVTDAQIAETIDNQVDAMSSADVDQQLQQFTRP